MKTSRLAVTANPCGATHPCASASTRPAQSGRSLRHLAAILCLALIGQTATAASVNLTWNPNSEPDIAGYKLSYGTSPGTYSSTLSTGTATGTSVSGLNEGQTYYFVVKAVNTAGLESAPSTEVSYQVPLPPNTAPVASSQSVSTSEDQAVAITVSATDAEGNPLSYRIASGPTMGTLSGSAPNLTYAPASNANGSDSFTFVANDGNEDSNIATVSITVSPVNDAPVAVAQATSTLEDKALGILLSASDRDGDSLSYRIISSPAKGSLSGTAPNLTYTPATDANGSDSFTFRVNDGTADSNTATVSISINPVNDAPVAVAQATSTLEDKALGILLSASDKDGDSLSYRIISSPAKGSLSGTAPNLTYTPATDANGSDSFSFRANDGMSDSNTATISITISPVNDAPVAAAQLVSATAGTPVGIVLSASDADGDSLTFSIVGTPMQGSLNGSPPNLTYTPNTNASGADSFSFIASDGKVNSNTSTVSINITASQKTENKAPVFQADLIARASGKTNETYTAESLAGSAIDPDGDVVSYSKAAGPDWLAISPDGIISGMPPTGAEGLNSFTIRASDPEGAFDEAVLEITITAPELPLPWSLGRIGSVSQDSTAWGDAVDLKIKSSGSFAGAADDGIFTWQTLSGDGDIIARISGLENARSNSRIGLEIRDSLASNSKHAFIGADGSGSLRFIRRTKTGGLTSTSNVGLGTVPNIWLRITRSGSAITVFTSMDGSLWNRVSKINLALRTSCYIGLMVSGGGSNLSTGVFQNVTVIP